jgi:phage shock protein PspC (stress-responsive transcriptional regulator)
MAREPVSGKAGVMNRTETATESGGTAPPADSGVRDSGPMLYRPNHDRILAGVASGIARYLRVDVLLVRIALVTLIFVGGIGLPLYVACWLLIPEEGASQSVASDFVHNLRA